MPAPPVTRTFRLVTVSSVLRFFHGEDCVPAHFLREDFGIKVIFRALREEWDSVKNNRNYYMIPSCLSNKCWLGGRLRGIHQLGAQISLPCVADGKDDLFAPVFRAAGDLYCGPGVGA